MKRVIKFLLVMTMMLSMSMTAFASESIESNGLSEKDAQNIAIWFIANDIYENNNNG